MSQIPVLSPTAYTANTDNKYNRLYNSPLFDYLSEMLPRNIKDLFKWGELVYANTPVVTNAVTKLINYPITDFVYKTESKEIREKTKKLVEKQLKLKSHLLQVGLEFYVYGNAFRSMYFPFTRFLRCKACGQKTNITHAKYRIKKDSVVLNCSCNVSGVAEIEDEYTKNMDDLRIVCWDPHRIDLASNPITGDTQYFYDTPKEIKFGVLQSNPVIFNTLPKVFFEAVSKNKKVQLGENLYHFKTPSLSGLNSGWGMSPLISTLKLYLYNAILRKGSEAIAMEQIIPKVIMYPEARTSDPSVSTSMHRWREEVTEAVKRWRRDPNSVMLSPYPTGVVNVGSQGKGLLPTAELKESREEIALALGVPPEFLYGNSGIQKSTVALRLLENQLTPFAEQLTEYSNWVISMINAKYDTDYCEVELQDFTIIDDLTNKQLLLQAVGQGVSSKSFQEALGLDPEEEKESSYQEQLDNYKQQKKLETDMAEIDRDVSKQTAEEQQAMESDEIPPYNQQKLIAKAQQLAQHMIAIPYEKRRSYMSQLQNEDYVMHSLVAQQLTQMHDKGMGPGGGNDDKGL